MIFGVPWYVRIVLYASIIIILSIWLLLLIPRIVHDFLRPGTRSFS